MQGNGRATLAHNILVQCPHTPSMDFAWLVLYVYCVNKVVVTPGAPTVAVLIKSLKYNVLLFMGIRIDHTAIPSMSYMQWESSGLTTPYHICHICNGMIMNCCTICCSEL